MLLEYDSWLIDLLKRNILPRTVVVVAVSHQVFHQNYLDQLRFSLNFDGIKIILQDVFDVFSRYHEFW